MRYLALAASLLASSPAPASAWQVDRHADVTAGGRVDHVAVAADPSTGGQVLLQCVGGMRSAYVSVADPQNAFHNKGDAATVNVQKARGKVRSYAGTMVAKRDGRVVFDVDDASFPGEFADGEERLSVETPYVRYLSVFDLSGTDQALAPVMACKG